MHKANNVDRLTEKRLIYLTICRCFQYILRDITGILPEKSTLEQNT